MNRAQLRDEIVRCGRDPVYFITKYAKVRHPQRGLIPFNLWDFQSQLIQDYLDHRFNVVLKARQLGVTETTAAFGAWMILFHRNKTVLCAATKGDTAKKLVRSIRTVLESIPKWLLLANFDTRNKMSLELSNGSIVKAITSSKDAGRSESVSLLVIDEAAHIKGFDEMWTGLFNTVSAGGRVIMLSTPLGVGNVFHKVYTDAVAGRNNFHPTKLMWWVHPEHIDDLEDDPDRPGFKTSTWFREETKGQNARDRAQEHECDFASSGNTVIDASALAFVESCVIQPMAMQNFDYSLWVWATPNKVTRYFLAADVARGDGADKCSFHVFETDTMLQVCEYDGRLRPDDYAALIDQVGREYNSCPVVIENNSFGLAVLEHLKLLEYPAVYCTKKGEDKGELVDMRIGLTSDDLVMGFTTSPKTRPVMISKFEEYIRTRQVTIRSSRTLGELKTFVWTDTGRPEALKNSHDDLVMAGALGVFVRDIYLAPNMNVLEVQKQMIASMKLARTGNNQIPGASKNPFLVPRHNMGAFNSPRNPYQINVARGVSFDLRELLDRKPGGRRG
jgi:hypothetical protein